MWLTPRSSASGSPLRAAALALCCAGCAATQTETSVNAADAVNVETPPRPEPIRLVLEDLAGRHLDVADHRGKAVLLLAFTIDNLASQALARVLERVARRHPDDLAVIAIAGDTGDRLSLHTLVDTWRSVTGLERVVVTLASDEVRMGASALGSVERVPTLFMVNRAGVIVRRLETVLSEPQVEALIAPALPGR